MASTSYHSYLRIAGVVLALVLLFDSGIIAPATKELSHTTYSYVASSIIGASATVPQNDLNVLTAELSQKNQEIEELRGALAEGRTIDARSFSGPVTNDSQFSEYILSTLLFIILVLIILNYILDYRRFKQISYGVTNT